MERKPKESLLLIKGGNIIMLHKIKKVNRAKNTEIQFIATLQPEDAKGYIRTVEDITKLANQIYRANHGGGMPCPDNICRSSLLSSFLDVF